MFLMNQSYFNYVDTVPHYRHSYTYIYIYTYAYTCLYIYTHIFI